MCILLIFLTFFFFLVLFILHAFFFVSVSPPRNVTIVRENGHYRLCIITHSSCSHLLLRYAFHVVCFYKNNTLLRSERVLRCHYCVSGQWRSVIVVITLSSGPKRDGKLITGCILMEYDCRFYPHPTQPQPRRLMTTAQPEPRVFLWSVSHSWYPSAYRYLYVFTVM